MKKFAWIFSILLIVSLLFQSTIPMVNQYATAESGWQGVRAGGDVPLQSAIADGGATTQNADAAASRPALSLGSGELPQNEDSAYAIIGLPMENESGADSFTVLMPCYGVVSQEKTNLYLLPNLGSFILYENTPLGSWLWVYGVADEKEEWYHAQYAETDCFVPVEFVTLREDAPPASYDKAVPLPAENSEGKGVSLAENPLSQESIEKILDELEAAFAGASAEEASSSTGQNSESPSSVITIDLDWIKGQWDEWNAALDAAKEAENQLDAALNAGQDSNDSSANTSTEDTTQEPQDHAVFDMASIMLAVSAQIEQLVAPTQIADEGEAVFTPEADIADVADIIEITAFMPLDMAGGLTGEEAQSQSNATDAGAEIVTDAGAEIATDAGAEIGNNLPPSMLPDFAVNCPSEHIAYADLIMTVDVCLGATEHKIELFHATDQSQPLTFEVCSTPPPGIMASYFIPGSYFTSIDDYILKVTARAPGSGLQDKTVLRTISVMEEASNQVGGFTINLPEGYYHSTDQALSVSWSLSQDATQYTVTLTAPEKKAELVSSPLYPYVNIPATKFATEGQYVLAITAHKANAAPRVKSIAFMVSAVKPSGHDITADFTDPNFLAAVRGLAGKPEPERILDTDVEGITDLHVQNMGIQNLAGLEHFTNLKWLYCNDNQLTSLPELPDSLYTLYCYGNQLGSLPDLPNGLRLLNCENNQISSLPELPGNLLELWCGNNPLAPLSNLPLTLKILDCSSTQLTALPTLPDGMTDLMCGDNFLTVLPDLPPSLEWLACGWNRLTGLNVSGLSLVSLHCAYNNLASESDVTGFTGEWDGDNYVFHPQNSPMTGTDITADFTDPNFLAAVRWLLDKPDGPIYDTDVAGLLALDVSVENIQSLAGIEHFVSLEVLRCNGNQLTELPALPSGLTELVCYDNQLTALPALPSGLTHLKCSDNRLTSLPVLPPALVELHCYDNRLTSLPALPPGLTKLECQGNHLSLLPALPPSLTILRCDDNQLTALPALPSGVKYLDCRYNQLTSLPDLPPALQYLECSQNRLTSLDVSGLSLGYLNCSYNIMANQSAVIGFTGAWDGYNYVFGPQRIKPVTDITGIPASTMAGTPLTLAGVVAPPDATNKTIVWSVVDAGTTGAVISGNTFTATAVGTAAIRATITNGLAHATDYTQSFTIAVTPVFTYAATISPLTGLFPQAAVGYTSPLLTFTVTNTGTGTITNLFAELNAGSDFFIFPAYMMLVTSESTYGGTKPATSLAAAQEVGSDYRNSTTLLEMSLAPGETAAVVHVMPKAGLAAGIHTGKLTITGSNGITLSANLRFTVVSYEMAVNPAGKSFPEAVAGYAAQTPQQFTITNTGTGTITNLTAALNADSDFEISTALSAANLTPGGIAAVGVRPKTGLTAGTHTGTLEITGSNGINLTANLSFTVVSYAMAVSPAVKSFPEAVVGYAAQTPQQFVITNTGTGILTGIAASLSKDSAFEISTALAPATITPGGTAAISVRPKTGLNMGTFTDTLTITASKNVNASAGLSFEVNPEPLRYSLSNSPLYGVFAAAMVGYVTQAPQLFTITNTGTGTITNLAATLGNHSVFEISGPLTQASLAPGASATITIRPKTGLAAGLFVDTLTITGSNGISHNMELSFTVKTSPAPSFTEQTMDNFRGQLNAGGVDSRLVEQCVEMLEACADETMRGLVLSMFTSGKITFSTATQNADGTKYLGASYCQYGWGGPNDIKIAISFNGNTMTADTVFHEIGHAIDVYMAAKKGVSTLYSGSVERFEMVFQDVDAHVRNAVEQEIDNTFPSLDAATKEVYVDYLAYRIMYTNVPGVQTAEEKYGISNNTVLNTIYTAIVARYRNGSIAGPENGTAYKAVVSDVYGGLTNNNIMDGYGHFVWEEDYSYYGPNCAYWFKKNEDGSSQRVTSRVAELWAEYVSAIIRNVDNTDAVMNAFFPSYDAAALKKEMYDILMTYM